MSKLRIAQLATSAALLCSALVAHADEGPEPTEQLTLPAHKLVLNGFFEANLSKDKSFKPISISPDIWYGATDKATVGLVHSSLGSTGFIGGVGDSLCLSGKKNNCVHPYPNVGADLRYRLASPLTLDTGLFIRNTSDPFQVALKIGVDARWRFDRLALEVLPSLFFGLTNRSKSLSPNRDWLYLPITVSYEVVDRFQLAVQTGLAWQLEHAGDATVISFALAGRYQVTKELGLGLAFALPRLVAPKKTMYGFDARTLTLGGSYAF
jgi:hypothetical protein